MKTSCRLRNRASVLFIGSCVGLAALAVSPQLAVATLPQAGDVVFGLNNSDPLVTLELIRGPATAGSGTAQTSPWTMTPWMQIVRFDNYNGISHNANGNLLGVNFGTSATGGEIYSLATTGSDPVPAGQLIGDLDAAAPVGADPGAITQSRLGLLGVSPDNTKIALTTYDTATIITYDYTPGDTMGGGAALSNGQEAFGGFLTPGRTQGLVWKDNSTIVTFSDYGAIFETDAATLNTTQGGSITTPDDGQGGSLTANFTSLAYNPAVSQYMYALFGAFDGTSTVNRLYVLDPNSSYSLVKEVDLSTSLQTARDIAIGPGGDLFMTQFGGSSAGGAGIDIIPAANALNPATIADNSSLDWYLSTTTASFSGLDVGFGSGGEELPGDFDGDDDVDGADFLILQRGTPGTYGASDYADWEANFGTGVPSTASVAGVPEPSSLLLGLAAGGLLLLRRRRGRN